MFLFAKLVMKNLYDQTSIFGLRTEMRDDVFPKGLDEAYGATSLCEHDAIDTNDC